MRCKDLWCQPGTSTAHIRSQVRQRRSAPRAGSQRNASDFGAPERRVTDILLVLNAAVYVAQLASKDRLTSWGTKVRSQPARCWCATQLAEVPSASCVQGNAVQLGPDKRQWKVWGQRCL